MIYGFLMLNINMCLDLYERYIVIWLIEIFYLDSYIICIIYFIRIII